jgi:hypothetical protein
MSNKQTAVQILVDSLIKLGYLHSNEFGQSPKVRELIEQAKEKEKEQHSNTWDDSRVEDKGDNYIGKQKSFNDYYEQTYGGNK